MGDVRFRLITLIVGIVNASGEVIKLLEACLLNSYCNVKETIYAHNKGFPKDSFLSPVIANFYMEWFEE